METTFRRSYTNGSTIIDAGKLNDEQFEDLMRQIDRPGVVETCLLHSVASRFFSRYDETVSDTPVRADALEAEPAPVQ